MASSSRFWADWTTLDFAHLHSCGLAARTIAVLPVAATEQHGPHLPLSVDTVLVDGIVAASLDHLPDELPVLFLPTQAVGLSPEHARFPGTLTLKNETILRLWTDMAESVAATGITKLVLFNSHGGNVSVMDLVARDLRARLDMLVYSVSWFNLPLTDAQGQDVNALFSAEEHRFGIHGGDIETSMVLALDPARVDMAQARNFTSAAQTRASCFEILGNGKSAKLGWQSQDYNPAGAVGDAANATAEKGQALIDAAGLALARLLVEVDHLPADTLTARPAFG
ncbi:MAG: creatininase family protein [Rhodoferax sp.]|uniref:creatininase family protein n=1 Tax=Rhodoferax sp. TaxID=50421 RepID=UPI0008D2D71B|nr:creatininase family protein [Rhodoferax sp.]MDP2678244.1 creatininase family protein [Rhodoferax sp.]OGB53095.1 MAG: creatininase [Burkholderiales bacterium RIFOXYD12_FULL_59_19]OGB73222.1 MAG: creatininase [Burkholderiales bacterium RIFOXYC12_FULL_60_6]OGB82915.1 MAG: creatininase [Burkholderiales bacterium RIFOXYD2_FULL_59_8]